MCTLVVLNEYVTGYPLIIAGNRDERYDRLSLSPQITSSCETSFIRPKDLEKDGTWLGVATDGWTVGLTNQDDGHHIDTAFSRGRVVVDCLEAGCHAAAAKVLKGLERPRYNPFNLFLCCVTPDRDLELEMLPPGVNVISNDCLGNGYQAKVNHAREAASRIDPNAGIDCVKSELLKILADHTDGTSEDPFQALCVHADNYAFGTKSTSIITVTNEKEVEYWYSEGHPCMSKGLSLAGHLDHP